MSTIGRDVLVGSGVEVRVEVTFGAQADNKNSPNTCRKPLLERDLLPGIGLPIFEPRIKQ